MDVLSISIVLYENDREVEKTIRSVLNAKINLRLYLIDNSKTDVLKYLAADERIQYTFNNANIGYGAAHNIAIKKSLSEEIPYHLVMNPDINFQEGTLEKIYAFMEENKSIGSLMPKVYYEDGSIQRLCKLLPTPLNLIGRRFIGNSALAKRKNEEYELHNFSYTQILDTPSLSGCFMFIRTEVLKKSGIFDPRYFMYLEDYDLTRRIHKVSRTVFYPGVSIIHGHAQESYKNGTLLKIHIRSAIKYFNKWGWLIDSERTAFNKKVLEKIKRK
ncbi:glycosyltransferase family 2 protein [Pedobacter metabolipauper]|uniref:Glycosyltransferase 2-like domain-containing protein n=1 Tax=Pedobacter metabolipauper TaxID=425513 RepID=A0A4R6SYX0_9SPHI|nr:glycosyltransferase family 2 protein [Pedobacter metabolipauper]TDQ09912.1 hypothetical protein ATK78_2071 [Pedobacter metabolipauper]